MEDTFYINQIIPKRTNEAIFWCNSHGAYLKSVENGWLILQTDPITSEKLIKDYEYAVQNHLDKTAQSKGYDNTYTCLSYLNSTDEKWKIESTIFNSWRDSVWQKCHEILNAFIAGELEQPTIEEVIEALPKIEW